MKGIDVMDFSIKIGNNIKIELGETKEELIYDLSCAKIRYTIPFDKTNDNNIKETILQIPSLRIEISIQNDIVNYIKSGCNEYSIIFKTEGLDKKNIAVINDLKIKIVNTFKIKSNEMFIEKINLRNFDTMVIMNSKALGKKVRLHLMSDLQGNVYINTLRYIK